jgi:large subunit ribosomal protein L10
MAITRAKKESLLAEMNEALSGAHVVTFVHFKGLSVPEINEVRAKLKEEGVKYTVVKKTLLKRTLDALGIQGEAPELSGEVAMAYLPKTVGEDITAPARNLNEFVKKFKERLQFLGGVAEGRYLTREETTAVAAIPPIPVLRGMFVNVINSPIQKLVIALDQVREKKA